MATPASHDAEAFLRRIFPESTAAAPDDADEGDDVREPLRGVDERRQRLLEPIGEPDRESW